MVGKLFDAKFSFDESFYDGLLKMINEEPILTRDMIAYSQLKEIGIEKGESFNPNKTQRDILKKAANDMHEKLMSDLIYKATPFWADKNCIFYKVGSDTEFSFILDDGNYDVASRAMIYFLACGTPKKLGAATFYILEFLDSKNNRFNGGKTYCLNVPPNVPAEQYWAATVYDSKTCCFIEESPICTIDSYKESMKINNEGSIDIYFGQNPPKGKENNCIYTKKGEVWFSVFRFYGPKK